MQCPLYCTFWRMFNNSTLFGTSFTFVKTAPKIRVNEVQKNTNIRTRFLIKSESPICIDDTLIYEIIERAVINFNLSYNDIIL